MCSLEGEGRRSIRARKNAAIGSRSGTRRFFIGGTLLVMLLAGPVRSRDGAVCSKGTLLDVMNDYTSCHQPNIFNVTEEASVDSVSPVSGSRGADFLVGRSGTPSAVGVRVRGRRRRPPETLRVARADPCARRAAAFADPRFLADSAVGTLALTIALMNILSRRAGCRVCRRVRV